MKIAYVGTYIPRECGIGTFTHNLLSYMTTAKGGVPNEHDAMVIAMDDQLTSYDYPKEVQYTVRQEQQGDYLEAAGFINLSGADVCILQHEFGIFGGQNGVYVLPLLHRLEIPLIVTLHTVLEAPSYNEKAVLIEICRMAAKIVVMTQKAVEFLTSIYGIAASKIEVIEHGAPDLRFDHATVKRQFKFDKKKVLFTFGFIGRNKGIETVIAALPAVVARHPDVVYVVLGKTHPTVLRRSGEEYRISLMRLTKSFALEKHVLFLNEFIDEYELFQYLHAADIYITPYVSKAQITSGTLSYALVAGNAVLSTPYWHAEELLADGRGCLFGFNDPEGLASLLNSLLDDPETLRQIRDRALAYGRGLTWPRSAARYLDLSSRVIQEKEVNPIRKDTVLDPTLLPPFLMDHIRRLTDDTGIIQHAKFGIPNLKEGYCLDDNARALLMVVTAYQQLKLPLALDLLPIYLSYIHYMQNEDGSFRNFLSFRRDFLDERGSEDSFGRTIWSLGYLLGNAPNDAYYQTGRLIFFDAVPNFVELKSIRSIAYTIIGISYYLKRNPNDEEVIDIVRILANKLVVQHRACATADWCWFEDSLTYDNAMLPLALLHAAETLHDTEVFAVAMATMAFVESKTVSNNALSLVGNENWYIKDGDPSRYAQQPLDAMAMVLMFHQAYQATGDKQYLDKLYFSYMWFLGENDLRISLYDFETKGCCDGLERDGVNRNQGAESTLAYLISQLTVLQAFEDVYTAKLDSAEAPALMPMPIAQTPVPSH